MTDQKPKIAYISGPMRGKAGFNYEAFNMVAHCLRNCRYIVINPADNFGGISSYQHKTYMRHDFHHVLQSDLIVVLDGWEQSEGAKAEVLVGQQIGIPILRWSTGSEISGDVLTTVSTRKE